MSWQNSSQEDAYCTDVKCIQTYRLNSIPVIIRLETRSLCIFKRSKTRNMRNIWVHNVAEMFSEFLHAAKQGEIRISELLLFIFYDSRMSIALLLFFDTRSVYFQTFKQDLQYEKIWVHNVAEILQILQIENLASLSLSLAVSISLRLYPWCKVSSRILTQYRLRQSGTGR